MKNSQILALVFAFVLGAAIVFGIGQLNQPDTGDLEQQLAELRAQNDRLEALVEGRKSSSGITTLPGGSGEEPKPLTATDAVVEEEPEEEPEEEEAPQPEDFVAGLMKLANSKEGRGFAKMMTSNMSRQGEAVISREIAKYSEKLDLTDEQTERLKERFTASMKEQTEAFNKKLDDESVPMQEIMEQQREVMRGQEDQMAEILREELDEDQFALFEHEQLVEKTQRVQRDADRELSSLDRDLELTPAQEDQVFGILVQTNSDYDESMGIEGVSAEVPLQEGQAKEDAIRAVLDAEQTETYNQSLEQRRQNPWAGRGAGGFGRGFGR